MNGVTFLYFDLFFDNPREVKEVPTSWRGIMNSETFCMKQLNTLIVLDDDNIRKVKNETGYYRYYTRMLKIFIKISYYLPLFYVV